MASYVIPTTADQDALLSWIVKQYNSEHDTVLTNQQYIGMRFGQLLAPYAERFAEFTKEQIGDAFQSASADTQSQVKTLLKVS